MGVASGGIAGPRGSEDLPEYILLQRQKEAARGLAGSGLGSSLTRAEVHAKDAALFGRLTAKQAKMENLMTEKERIEAKESSQEGGLTEGQARQAAKNDFRKVIIPFGGIGFSLKMKSRLGWG